MILNRVKKNLKNLNKFQLNRITTNSEKGHLNASVPLSATESETPKRRQNLTIKAGILLKRNAILVKPLKDIERDYLLYKELQLDSETRPFAPEFYFKKGSLPQQRFNNAQNLAPEIVVQPADPELLEWAETEDSETQESVDKEMQSLDRMPDCPVYLCLEHKAGWRLPVGKVDGKFLHEAAPEILESLVGSKMDTWFVGKIPAAHLKSPNETTFIMKAHIMAGRIDIPSKKETDIISHAWLTKLEASKVMDKDYFEVVGKIMSD